MEKTFTIHNITIEEMEKCLAVLRPVAPWQNDAAPTSIIPAADPALASVAPAPATDPAPAESIHTTTSVDSRGIPYDTRVHSAGDINNRLKVDGTWKMKRGVEAAFVAQVEAELLGQAAPAPAQGNPLPVEPAGVAPAGVAPAATVPAQQPALVPVTGVTHAEMMTQVVKTLQDTNNPLEAMHIPQLYLAYGFNDLPSTINSPEAYQAIYKHLIDGTVPQPVA